MIISQVLGLIFVLINTIVLTIPGFIMANDSFDITSLSSLIAKGLIVFPLDLFQLCLSNIVFWLSVQMIWAIVEWIYKKIPGVN